MFKLKQVGVAAVLVLVAASAMATNFRVSDQVYVPVAGHVDAGNATFISDVFISNMSTTDNVTVTVIYSQFGANPTPQYFDSNPITLKPLERREFVDFFKTFLGQSTAFGSLIFNGCKSGADCVNSQDPDGNSVNFRDIAVFTRIYSVPKGVTLDQNPPTNGQDMPGIPWYNFVSSRQASAGLSRVFITGVRNTGTGPGTYRTNIGLMNASQYNTTTLVVKLYNGATGAQIGSDFRQTLGPLGFVQPGIGTMFPSFAAGPTSTNAFVTVEQESNVPTGDAPSSCLPDGCAAFLTYGSILDNQTTDATTVEAVYEKALSGAAIDAIYGTNGAGKSLTRRAVRRH
jgi:hypothetical protein